MRQQPSSDLPVAAQPAMFATVVRAVMRRIIFDYFDISDQPRASVSAFDQVVTEQRILREAMLEYALHHWNFVNPFTRENPFAVQILVNIRDRMGVNIHSGLTGINIRQPRTGSALYAYSHPR